MSAITASRGIATGTWPVLLSTLSSREVIENRVLRWSMHVGKCMSKWNRDLGTCYYVVLNLNETHLTNFGHWHFFIGISYLYGSRSLKMQHRNGGIMRMSDWWNVAVVTEPGVFIGTEEWKKVLSLLSIEIFINDCYRRRMKHWRRCWERKIVPLFYKLPNHLGKKKHTHADKEENSKKKRKYILNAKRLFTYLML